MQAITYNSNCWKWFRSSTTAAEDGDDFRI